MSLKNEQIVFTGTLNSMFRKQAQSLVSSLKGCNQNNLSKQTTILVIGSRQNDLLKEQQLSKKVMEATRLMNEGFPIQLLTEKQFIKLVSEQFHLLYENL